MFTQLFMLTYDTPVTAERNVGETLLNKSFIFC